MFETFDPDKHSPQTPLYELSGTLRGDLIVDRVVRSRIPYKLAARNPTAYFVKTEEIVARGGPGSGNFGHAGRPGKRGGSAPRGEGTKEPLDPDERPPEDITLDPDRIILQTAKQLREKAEKVEPVITEKITTLAEQLGGETPGLEYRLKTPESLTRKLAKEAELFEGVLQRPDEFITDAVRYTCLFEPENFVEKVTAFQESLAKDGWVQYDHKWTNYFKEGGLYRGYNTVYTNDAGDKFELQFHTPESHSLKKQSHLIYSEFRTLPPDSPEAQTMMQQMRDLWSGLTSPKNWERLPGVVR